ncbi:MAG: hypothetical protein Q7R60_02955 [bacterium]|nr:hypothetical protein [bacterium]
MLADLIYWFARKIYGLSDDERVNDCNVVIALGYGFSSKGLPDAAQKTTKTAAQIAKQANVPLVICNVNYFGEDKMRAENTAKRKIIKQQQFVGKIILAKPCQNSVTEARNIKQALLEAGVNPQTITVVCDWPHARSTRIIYKKTFPNSTIRIVSVNANWDENHLVPAQQSNLKWLIANFKRHAALRVIGLNLVAKIQYKQKNEADSNSTNQGRRVMTQRKKKLLIVGGFAFLFLIVWTLWPSGKKQNMATSPNPSVTTSALQHVEAALKEGFAKLGSRVEALENTLTKGLADLNSRVEVLEKRPIQQAVSSGAMPSSAKAEKPAVGESKPLVPSLPSSVITVVDLAPVVEGLNGIAEAIKGSNPSQFSVSGSPTAEAELPQPFRPCAGWAQEPVQYRRCRIWNQLPP